MKPTRPYQICELTNDPQLADDQRRGIRCRRLVETISMPFPTDLHSPESGREHAIMVRMVPGDPTTLAEVNVNDLELYVATKMKWLHYADITGTGSFPTDMLRYDFCQLVDHTLHIGDREDRAGWPTYFKIVQVSNWKKPRWTPDRWRSFMWSITPGKTLPIGWADKADLSAPPKGR